MKLFSTLDCARLLKIAEHKITYAHRHCGLAEPTYHVAGKRVYTEEDLERIAEHFDIGKAELKKAVEEVRS